MGLSSVLPCDVKSEDTRRSLLRDLSSSDAVGLAGAFAFRELLFARTHVFACVSLVYFSIACHLHDISFPNTCAQLQ